MQVKLWKKKKLVWLVTLVKFRYKNCSQLEEVVFVEEKFLYKKISKKDVYVDYGATADIPQDTVKQYGDLTALK